MIIGVVARSPAPPAGPPCCGLGGLLCGLPRGGGLLRLPRGLLFRSPAPPAGPPCCGLGGLLLGLPRVGGLLRLPRGLLFRRPVVRLGPRHDRLVSSLSQRARKACAACA